MEKYRTSMQVSHFLNLLFAHNRSVRFFLFHDGQGLSEQKHELEMKKALKGFSEEVKHINVQTTSLYEEELRKKITESFKERKIWAVDKKVREANKQNYYLTVYIRYFRFHRMLKARNSN